MVMKKTLFLHRYIVAGILCLGIYHTHDAVTLVYNLKVRRMFALQFVLTKMKPRIVWSTIPILFARKSHNVNTQTNVDVHEKRKAGGALFNIRYVPSKKWWVELSTGLETDQVHVTGSDSLHASRFGADDVLLSGGYRHFLSKKGQLAGYGLVGVPVKRTLSLKDRHGPLVGTRIHSLGLGAEGSYRFYGHPYHSCTAILQGRFIHGFNRSWFPILPRGSTIQPGNRTDVLFALQFREQKTVYEAGYNATLFSNQARHLPTTTTKIDNFVRHSGYASVLHAVSKGFFNKPLVVGAGFNIGHITKPHVNTVTFWVNISLVF